MEEKMKERIFANYFMHNRYKEYEEFLNTFLKENYKFLCVKEYEKLKLENEKHIILRHDIDSDIKIAKRLFEIERKLNIKSTYYFRLCTLNKKLISEIHDYGSEVGYHYEEIAQYCKDHKNFSKDFVNDNIDKMKDIMLHNINEFEKKAGIKIYSIASHGDFINRKIGITNKYLYDDDMKKRLNLIEAYDIEKMINFRTADSMYPKFWSEDYKKAIETNSRNVLVLIHPRWWDKAPIIRTKLEFERVIEGIRYI